MYPILPVRCTHTDVERATPGVFLLKYCAFHALKSMCAVVNVVDGTTTKAEEFFLVQCPSFIPPHNKADDSYLIFLLPQNPIVC